MTFDVLTVPVLVGAALLTAIALLVRGVFLGYPRPSIAAKALSAKEQAIVAAAADALFPPGGPIPVSGTEAGLVAYTDRYMSRLGATQRILVHLLLHFVEHGPWIFGPRLARFTKLSTAERVAALKAMSQSPIYFRRISFLSLRVILTMGYLANDEVTRRIGVVADTAPFERKDDRGRVSAPAGEVFA